MNELVVFIGLAVGFFLIVMIMQYRHIPKKRITNNLKNQILENGLIHFTLWENAVEIQTEGLVPGKKRAMNWFEKNMVWMYINDGEEFKTKCDIIRSKGERKKYDAVVTFLDIQESQLKRMRYRESDKAVVHIGTFKTDSIIINRTKEREMKKLVPALKESLFEPTYDLAADYAETALDMLFESDALQEIPVVKTITALCKVGYNLHERNLIKQTLSFINGFNAGNIDPEKLEKYRKMLDSDPQRAEKELGRVIIILGNQVENIQSKVLGSFYSAYVKSAISWEKFCELSEANRRMFVSDYAVLGEAARNDGIDIGDRELYQVDRLISLGLLQNSNRLGGSIWIENMDLIEKEKNIIITSFGKTFSQHLPVLKAQ